MFLFKKSDYCRTFGIAMVVMLSMLGGGVRAQSISTMSASIDDLASLKGKTADDVKNSSVAYNSFPTDDKEKIFFLYNVSTGLLANAGGYWGTHISLQEFGMPLWVFAENGYVHFKQHMDKSSTAQDYGEGICLEYTTNSYAPDAGIFIDRNIYSNGSLNLRGWYLEAVGDDKNTYRLYTYKNRSTTSTSSRYYLTAAAQQGDVDKNCEAVLKSSSDYDDERSEWRIFSYQQLYDLQSSKIGLLKSLDLSFKLQCPGFNRENGGLTYWKTKRYDNNTSAKSAIRFGLNYLYKTSTAFGASYNNNGAGSLPKNYSFPDGDANARVIGSSDEYERYLGKYYCADIKAARGAIYQTVHVDHAGAYVIECKGFSTTTKAKLFACLLQDAAENPTDETIDENSVHETVLMQVENMSDEEQKALHVSEMNMDYAGKEFYGSHKYFNSVLVLVPKGGGNICFGIFIGSADDAEAEDSEWTVFDDFRLLFACSDTEHDLILDEDKDNLDYLQTCSQTYENVILHLNKATLKKKLKKWNTIVLPVDLTKDQFTQAFGSNARLAVLDKLTANEINFKTVEISKKGNDDVVLTAYVPYLIYPTKDLTGERTPVYTANLTETGTGEEMREHKVKIDRNHIDIPNVSFKKTSDNKNDLTYMNTDDWTVNLSALDEETKKNTITTDGSLVAYGTFARTFGSHIADTETKFTVDKSNPIISGRDDLRGCYFFDQGKMYNSQDKVRGLRGFSVWFKPASAATSGSAKFKLDDIDFTTEITQVMEDSDPVISRFANAIYNLNGQVVRTGTNSTAGLPSGIYIVNGKKQFVK